MCFRWYCNKMSQISFMICSGSSLIETRMSAVYVVCVMCRFYSFNIIVCVQKFPFPRRIIVEIMNATIIIIHHAHLQRLFGVWWLIYRLNMNAMLPVAALKDKIILDTKWLAEKFRRVERCLWIVEIKYHKQVINRNHSLYSLLFRWKNAIASEILLRGPQWKSWMHSCFGNLRNFMNSCVNFCQFYFLFSDPT